jgi:hypothetical protein
MERGDNALPPSFLKNRVPVQTQLDAPESSWIDKITRRYVARETGRFCEEKKRKKPKRDKTFQARLDRIEAAARQLKSSQKE